MARIKWMNLAIWHTLSCGCVCSNIVYSFIPAFYLPFVTTVTGFNLSYRIMPVISPTSVPRTYTYCQASDISCTLVGNKIVDHSDVVGAPPVDAVPTTYSFSIHSSFPITQKIKSSNGRLWGCQTGAKSEHPKVVQNSSFEWVVGWLL